MKKRLIISSVLLVVFLLLGYIGYNLSLKSATLTVSSEKTIEMDNIKYTVSPVSISKEDLDGKIGKVRKVVIIGSPSPDPYKKYHDVKNIYKIKGKKIEAQAAWEWNGSFYLLKH